jgi:hypothetical protein
MKNLRHSWRRMPTCHLYLESCCRVFPPFLHGCSTCCLSSLCSITRFTWTCCQGIYNPASFQPWTVAPVEMRWQ